MKIMISQPMKGKTKEQIEAERAEAVELLKKEGHTVVDTVFADNSQEAQRKPIWFLSKSIEAMSSVDGVVFLQGWENARGCKIEHEIALHYGLFVKEL